MNKKFHIAVLVGSLRRGSFSRQIAHALAELAPDGLQLELVEIGQLPLYNQDLDENPPTAFVEFRNRIKAADALLFVTPEYNRSIPSVLKNAVDVGSRPFGHSVWKAKPAAIVSLSPGPLGGFGANHHLRQCLACLDVPTLGQPEVYLGGVDKLLDQNGALNDERTRAFLTKFMDAYAAWIRLHART